MKSIELKAQREAAEKKWDALLEGRKDDATKEEHEKFMSQFKSLRDEITRLNEEIEVALESEKIAQRKADRVAAQSKKGSEEVRASRDYSLARAFKISDGKERFDGLEKEVHDQTVADSPSSWSPEGVAIPAEYMRISPKAGLPDNERRTTMKAMYAQRDLNVTTPGDGGYTVPTDLGTIVPVLMPTPLIRTLGATILGGQTANLDFPRGATRASAAWEGEVDANAETSPTFDDINLRPKRVGAYAVVSKRLIIQSNVAIEAYIRDLMSSAVDEKLDEAAFNGSGIAPVPEGIENITGVGSVTTTNLAGFTEAKAYEFKQALSAAYALKGNLGWVTKPTIADALRQLNIDAGSGIRLLGGIAGQMNNNMLTYPVFESDLLAAGDTIFGNWSELLLAQWGALDIVVNPYSLDTTNQVRLTINSHWDVNVKHPASFAMAVDSV